MAKDFINFKPIYAEDFNIGDTFKAEVEKAARIAGNKLVNDLRKPTRTWEEKPQILSQKTFNSREITVEAFIDPSTPGGQHYLWLDEGTAEHEIEATGIKYMNPALPRALVFHETFSPKTTPGTLSSSKGVKSGRLVHYKDKITTSIKARGFIKTVEEEWENWFFVKTMEDVLDKIARKFNS